MSSTPDFQQPVFCGFRNADDLHAVLAGEIAARLGSGVAQSGRASFVVSGGTTPGPLYDMLSARAVPWTDVTVTLSDERWVDPTSERSNEHLIRTRLLVGAAAQAQFVPLKTMHLHAAEAEPHADSALSAMPRPFDVVLLGMGDDGHTASLIPGSVGLARALDTTDAALARAVDPPRSSAMGERMTLTLRALLDARWIALLIRGQAKLDAYRHALAGHDVDEAPVRAVLHQAAVPVSVFWSD
ncbi:MAG: 6-phosphogluconolactonase [Rhizomicrobium sp.]